MTEFIEREKIFQVLLRTSFTFEEVHLAAEVALGIDWSVADVLDWLPYMWKCKEIFSIDAHEYVCREDQQDVSVANKRWWFLSCLGPSIVRMRKLHMVTNESHQSRPLLLNSLLLPLSCHSAWTVFDAATFMTTRLSTTAMAAPSRLVRGKRFGISSTVIVTCHWNGVIARFLIL